MTSCASTTCQSAITIVFLQHHITIILSTYLKSPPVTYMESLKNSGKSELSNFTAATSEILCPQTMWPQWIPAIAGIFPLQRGKVVTTIVKHSRSFPVSSHDSNTTESPALVLFFMPEHLTVPGTNRHLISDKINEILAWKYQSVLSAMAISFTVMLHTVLSWWWRY